MQIKESGKNCARNTKATSEAISNSIASSQGVTGGVGSGVVNRLLPVTTRLVHSLVRKVSSPLWSEVKKRTTKRLIYGESAPYFALVGVTLVSGSQQGILTKNDEVEALCGNIRVSIIVFLCDDDIFLFSTDLIS